MGDLISQNQAAFNFNTAPRIDFNNQTVLAVFTGISQLRGDAPVRDKISNIFERNGKIEVHYVQQQIQLEGQLYAASSGMSPYSLVVIPKIGKEIIFVGSSKK